MSSRYIKVPKDPGMYYYIVDDIQPERCSVVETDDQLVIKKSIFNMIVGFSKEMPFLYFLDADDHEWGFTIFDHGCEIVSFNVQHGEIIDSVSILEIFQRSSWCSI